MKRLAGLIGGVVLMITVAAAPAGAATVAVSISGFAFSPTSPIVAQGTTVTWTNFDAFQHTSTSNQLFWRSARLSTNQSFSFVFRNAGSFGYHCEVHPDMTGTIRVPIKASGSSSTGWTLRWSSLSSTPTNRSFDVQIKRPGSTSYVPFRTDTKARTAFFNPPTTGFYSFRARLDNLTNGKSSNWSPVRTLRIT